MILDQIIAGALEQLPESHTHTLAFHLLKERERAARAEADRDKFQTEAAAWKAESFKLQNIEAAAREVVKEAENPGGTRWIGALASLKDSLR